MTSVAKDLDFKLELIKLVLINLNLDSHRWPRTIILDSRALEKHLHIHNKACPGPFNTICHGSNIHPQKKRHILVSHIKHNHTTRKMNELQLYICEQTHKIVSITETTGVKNQIHRSYTE